MLRATKVNGVEIPEWAQCYCVVQHRPAYLYPYPYQLPDGKTLYLCPNTHHQLSTLYKMYQDLGGCPELSVLVNFNTVSQRLARMAYQMHLAMEAEDGEN